MKRKGCLFEQITDYQNIVDAFQKAAKGKRWKQEVMDFRADFDANITSLRQSIISDNVRIGNYHFFTIYDPKCRTICAASFPERILHHALMNLCRPVFERHFIADTYATREGKGIYKAIEKAQMLMKRYPYVVKLDYRKYYDSINHVALKQKLRRLFKDKRLLLLFDRIIDSYSVADGDGLPIGNLTSQFFANYFLSDIDHAMKEKERIEGYVRYMDDILMMSSSKEKLKMAVGELVGRSTRIGLALKPPLYRHAASGVNFLGYKVFPHYYVLSGRSKRRYADKVGKYHKLYSCGDWDERTLNEHLVPLTAFASHGSNIAFMKSVMNRVEVV